MAAAKKAEWENRIVGHGKVDPKKLKAHPLNWRMHPASQKKALKQIIDEIGYVDDVIVNKRTGLIVDGHLRVELAKEQGEKKLPVKYVDLSEEEEKLVLAMFDPIGGMVTTDHEKLDSIMADIRKGHEELLSDIGHRLEPLDGLVDPDEVPDPPKKPVTKPGDLWQLGEHRLLCGDSTRQKDVDRFIGDLDEYNLLTDPPYNISFEYNSIKDNLLEKEYSEFCIKWFQSFNPKAIIFSPGPRNIKYYPEPRDIGIWIKRNPTAGASVFHLRCAEPILFYGKIERKRNTDVFEYSTGFPCELKKAQVNAGVKDKHPPAKSMKLWHELISMFDKSIIVDCFVGNGTTIIACEQLNRKCYAMEIDPAYCDVAVERWENFTGKKAKRINGQTRTKKRR